jgi:hypothetical protein
MRRYINCGTACGVPAHYLLFPGTFVSGTGTGNLRHATSCPHVQIFLSKKAGMNFTFQHTFCGM